MKFRLLPIVLLSTLALVGCGGSDVPPEDPGKEVILPEEHANPKYTFTVNNLEELQAGWPQGAEKEFDLSVYVDGVEGNPLAEQLSGNLELIANHTKALTVTGFKVTANQLGTWKIAVKYYDTVKHYSFEISDQLPEPAIEKNMTISQVLEDVENHDMNKMYEVEGVVAGFHSKDAWNKYGEFDLADPNDNEKFLYFYGTRVSNKYISWDGTAGKYVYSSADAPYDVLENDMTKDLKRGDTAKLRVVYTAQYKNFYGVFVSVTAGSEVPATSVTLDKAQLNIVEGLCDTLSATILPNNCTQKLSWSTSDPSVAVVSEKGKVTAVGAGNATITAKVGDKTATCPVTVTAEAANNITINSTRLGLKAEYGKSTEDVAIKGVNFAYTQLAEYGDGIQMRIKKVDGQPSTEPDDTSKIWNTSATTKDIQKVTFNPSSKNTYSNENAFKVEFSANADFSNAESVLVSTQGTTSVEAAATQAGAKYMRITLLLAYSFYFDSIVLTLAE